MTESNSPETQFAWIRQQLDDAVEQVLSRGVINDKLAEARPVWSIPDKVMIGQIRVPSEPGSFIWIICGDFPVDCIGASVAATARDAARHFSLKWQLDAAQQNEPSLATILIRKAEELYEFAEEDRLWENTLYANSLVHKKRAAFAALLFPAIKLT